MPRDRKRKIRWIPVTITGVWVALALVGAITALKLLHRPDPRAMAAAQREAAAAQPAPTRATPAGTTTPSLRNVELPTPGLPDPSDRVAGGPDNQRVRVDGVWLVADAGCRGTARASDRVGHEPLIPFPSENAPRRCDSRFGQRRP
jgi:hypothetical protein